MTTPQQTTTGQAKDPAKAILDWLTAHRRMAYGIAAALAAVAFSGWFYVSYRHRLEARAGDSLQAAQVAMQTGNLALAASDLSRLVSEYSGTIAAGEGAVMLGRVRLIQDQPTLAAEELRRAIDGGLDDQFRAPALGLLGAALEDIGNMSQAGEAYERAAAEAWYPFLAAEYLNDAGRAYVAAHDTAAAVAAYQRVVDGYQDSPGLLEARVRLAELKAAQQPASN